MDYFEILLKAGSLSGLLSFVYLIFQNLRRRPKFKIDFQGSHGKHFMKDNLHFFEFGYTGIIKNQSLDPNTVTKLYLAVWGNKQKTSSLRFGSSPLKIIDKTKGEEVRLPIMFAPREAKTLSLTYQFPVKGTADEKILTEYIEVGNNAYLPKHTYEVCTEDTAENLYDNSGNPLNRREIDLRWTLPNTVRDLQKGKRLPLIKHNIGIAKARLYFYVKRASQALGLWK